MADEDAAVENGVLPDRGLGGNDDPRAEDATRLDGRAGEDDRGGVAHGREAEPEPGRLLDEAAPAVRPDRAHGEMRRGEGGELVPLEDREPSERPAVVLLVRTEAGELVHACLRDDVRDLLRERAR